ncbi:hypothetical protein CFC21_070396 [Triticum aestivum]|uniref:GH16 domain-containing protein n=2 Tax=Triticum aestivum TaxID=4565 RepID=A0A9R1HEF0_WHEAT|nr:uncharacterized protein LOC119307790 isoform X1 [Triticum dicoccoides]XP_037439767.1 uncharacterized protein LOC119307790 isoform X1 [Triticum dicoccoides]XP_044387268.1 uncharacterized protein LOC123110741 isoform X1 [Triticum aestivum]XP_044387269.1 uncharacterized protein LOC123110741 isoform X1 [Triticum aestivum]KAF7028451.1 hypothetical protein CFC21_040369 [Triticum aestivum]KAF7063934.1 hypothetical protein CFC21_070396 [Triticum aestivum]
MLRGSLWRLLAVAVAVPAATRAVAALKAGRSLHRDFDDGRVVELALDRETGSRLESKDRYLFGRFDLDIRLVADESAGTITSFYEGSSGCEPGGGSARPSHGAAAADSLPASFVFMWICMASDVALPMTHLELLFVTPVDVPEFFFVVVGCCHKTCNSSKMQFSANRF